MARLGPGLRARDGARSRRAPTPLPAPNPALLGFAAELARARRALPAARRSQADERPSLADEPSAVRASALLPPPPSSPPPADELLGWDAAAASLERDLAVYEGALRGTRSTRPPWLRKPRKGARFSRLLVYVLVACAAFVSAADQLPTPPPPRAEVPPAPTPLGSASAEPAATPAPERAPAALAPVRSPRIKRATRKQRARSGKQLATRAKRKHKPRRAGSR